MKNMKSALAVFLSAAMLLGMTACAGEGSSSSEESYYNSERQGA